MKKNTGFTLIELLLVIAIIGILSSIVLTSINRARSKGRDAAARADLSSVRSTATIYFDENNNTYGTDGTTCSNINSVFDPGANNNLNSIVLSAQAKVQTTAACANDAIAYVIALPLQDGGTWCIDSTGYASTTSLSLSGAGSVLEHVACQ